MRIAPDHIGRQQPIPSTNMGRLTPLHTHDWTSGAWTKNVEAQYLVTKNMDWPDTDTMLRKCNMVHTEILGSRLTATHYQKEFLCFAHWKNKPHHVRRCVDNIIKQIEVYSLLKLLDEMITHLNNTWKCVLLKIMTSFKGMKTDIWGNTLFE